MAITATLLTTTAMICSTYSIVGLLLSCRRHHKGGNVHHIIGSGHLLQNIPHLVSCFFHEIKKVISVVDPLRSKEGLYILLGLLYSAICATGNLSNPFVRFIYTSIPEKQKQYKTIFIACDFVFTAYSYYYDTILFTVLPLFTISQ